MQLQAAYKLHGRDSQKSADILKKSIEALAEAITLLRDTVHNIKPKEKLGVEYIKNIINDFKFCDINFSFSGDFNRISPNYLEIFCTNIKEALTNVSKHSNATRVDIKIDINELYTRVYIKDNGNNSNNDSKKITEGLGLSGMRERVLNANGSISISSEDGFMITCIIPFENSGGGKIFESINS
jgi:signal transduction histidine kinase